MAHRTQVGFKLQDGSLFSLPRRFKKHSITLLQKLACVADGRSRQGLRHPLENILMIVLYSMLCGCTHLAEIVEFAHTEEKFFRQILEMPHGIPHATTISYALQLCDVSRLSALYLEWREAIYGTVTDCSASFDGKTMNGVHGEGVVSHILTLLSHTSLTPLGQIGVTDKENEIPAARRLFDQISPHLCNVTLVGDALHTQTATAALIRKHSAHYLLMVKDNQKSLCTDIAAYFMGTSDTLDTTSDFQSGHGCHITTTVRLSHDPVLLTYLGAGGCGDNTEGWKDVSTVGIINRTGTRTRRGVTTSVDETVYFIASTPRLTAHQALQYIRNHWKIENNLHRTKDVLYREDQQTLRLGSAPQVMTFLRSMVINLFRTLTFALVSQSTRILRNYHDIRHAFVHWSALA